jgi:hypothetical protein
MRSKLCTFILASTALVAAALATLPAVAATSTTLNVPFSFIVNGKSLPAGEYSVQCDSSGSLVRFASKDASQRFTWIAEPTATSSDKVILKFDPQGETHVLESVQYGTLVTVRIDRKSRKSGEMPPQYVPGQ